MTAPEPVIVAVPAHGRHPRRATVADVLLAPGEARCAELFRRYPGLTLVVLTGRAAGLAVGVRDGLLLTLPPTAYPTTGPPDNPAAAARLVYAWWAAGVDPASPEARRSAASAGLRVSVGRWRPPRPVGHRAERGQPATHVGGAGRALPVEDPQG